MPVKDGPTRLATRRAARYSRTTRPVLGGRAPGRRAEPGSRGSRFRRSACPAFGLALLTTLALAPAAAVQPVTLRIGHFPNITHVQALVAHGLSRKGQGWFEQRLGPDATIEWFVYNAGPSAMEAVFADSIDLTYVGPSPAINAYAKARGAGDRDHAGHRGDRAAGRQGAVRALGALPAPALGHRPEAGVSAVVSS